MKNLLLGMFCATVILTAIMAAKAAGGSGALVVAVCGTMPKAYSAGSTRTLTVNTNGQVCQ